MLPPPSTVPLTSSFHRESVPTMPDVDSTSLDCFALERTCPEASSATKPLIVPVGSDSAFSLDSEESLSPKSIFTADTNFSHFSGSEDLHMQSSHSEQSSLSQPRSIENEKFSDAISNGESSRFQWMFPASWGRSSGHRSSTACEQRQNMMHSIDECGDVMAVPEESANLGEVASETDGGRNVASQSRWIASWTWQARSNSHERSDSYDSHDYQTPTHGSAIDGLSGESPPTAQSSSFDRIPTQGWRSRSDLGPGTVRPSKSSGSLVSAVSAERPCDEDGEEAQPRSTDQSGLLHKMTEGLRQRRERHTRERHGSLDRPRTVSSLAEDAPIADARRRSYSEGDEDVRQKIAKTATWSKHRGRSAEKTTKVEVVPAADPAATWSNPLSWVTNSTGKWSWLYSDANFLLDAMAPRCEKNQMPLQEFELADMLQAGAKLVDVGDMASEISVMFWIFLISMILLIASLLYAIVDLWITAAVSYWGWFAYGMLFVAASISWPQFIHYLVQTITRGYHVKSLHERTVQLHGIPPVLRTYEAMEEFCQERQLPIKSIYVAAPLYPDSSDPRKERVELMFGSPDEMKKAFKDKSLAPHMKMRGAWVRVRPKSGSSAATVEWILVLMEYLCNSVPPRFWRRCTLSCLITMSLTRTLSHALVMAATWCRSRMGVLMNFFGYTLALVSLCFVFFYVGYHSYIDIADARQDLKNEQRQDRRFEPPAPPTRNE